MAAVEFAMLALPFFLFILGVIGMGLYFFTNSSLDYAVETASRKIRTGEVNTGGSNGGNMTVGEFRDLVCTTAKPMLDCSKLAVLVQHASDWSGIAPTSCVDGNGNITNSTGSKDEFVAKYSGDASDVVLITLCYQWDLANQFSFLKLGSGGNKGGPAIMQSASAFKSEPYN
jgi:Flp pilus assembly protein TadG